MSSFFNPVRILFGIGQTKKITPLLASLGHKPLFLMGSSSLRTGGYLNVIKSQLPESTTIIDGIPSNPNVQDLFFIMKRASVETFDSILAVGGGSVIDTGKILAAFQDTPLESPEELREAVQKKSYCLGPCPPLLAVPTTAGTGSEVTSWATLWDRELGLKYSVEHPGLYPKLALVDPLLTMNLPAEMTASSALDALSHATEAYWSRNSNEIVRMFALRSISYISDNLVKLLDNLNDLSLREKVAYGSLFAGLAFSNTRTTACHSISYPLTLSYDINHGIAVSLTLGKMLHLNRDVLADKKELLEAFGASDIEDVQLFIERVFKKAGLSSRLRDYGIPEGDLEAIACQSFTPGRMDNNPVDLDRPSILELLKSIY